MGQGSVLADQNRQWEISEITTIVHFTVPTENAGQDAGFLADINLNGIAACSQWFGAPAAPLICERHAVRSPGRGMSPPGRGGEYGLETVAPGTVRIK